MNKQDLITRVETMLLYYNKQFDTAQDLHKRAMRVGGDFSKDYTSGRIDQLIVVLADVKKLLEEVKSLEVDKKRKLVKVVEYYE